MNRKNLSKINMEMDVDMSTNTDKDTETETQSGIGTWICTWKNDLGIDKDINMC
jgi:hypothetical protein